MIIMDINSNNDDKSFPLFEENKRMMILYKTNKVMAIAIRKKKIKKLRPLFNV